MPPKVWYKSRLVWSGLLQSVVGVLGGVILLLQNGFSVEAMTAMLVALKGIIDVMLRLDTNQPVQ